jgi:hypothetical protein
MSCLLSICGTLVGMIPDKRNFVYAPPSIGVSCAVILHFLILHLAFSFEVCRLCQFFGSLIRHAILSLLSPLPLRISVIFATLI